MAMHRKLPSAWRGKALKPRMHDGVRVAKRQFASTKGTMIVAMQSSQLVETQIEKTSWTSRKLFARISVQAPPEVVWSCLTDYDELDTFIPSLAENVCLQRKQNGARLKQVGVQEVALGIKFSAACVLDCTEYPSGVPLELCDCAPGSSSPSSAMSENNNRSTDAGKPRQPQQKATTPIPYPRNSQPGAPSMDIVFQLVEGDFQTFQGVWRMQPLMQSGSDPDIAEEEQTTLLCYALYVQPKPWLPVGLIQKRIEREVQRNLHAVRSHAEQTYVRDNGQPRFAPSDTGLLSEEKEEPATI